MEESNNSQGYTHLFSYLCPEAYRKVTDGVRDIQCTFCFNCEKQVVPIFGSHQNEQAASRPAATAAHSLIYDDTWACRRDGTFKSVRTAALGGGRKNVVPVLKSNVVAVFHVIFARADNL